MFDSGLELRVDYLGKARLFFRGEALPGQYRSEIEFRHRESGTLRVDFTMRCVKLVHVPKPDVVPEVET